MLLKAALTSMYPMNCLSIARWASWVGRALNTTSTRIELGPTGPLVADRGSNLLLPSADSFRRNPLP
jgi:hypothetical protein